MATKETHSPPPPKSARGTVKRAASPGDGLRTPAQTAASAKKAAATGRDPAQIAASAAASFASGSTSVADEIARAEAMAKAGFPGTGVNYGLAAGGVLLGLGFAAVVFLLASSGNDPRLSSGDAGSLGSLLAEVRDEMKTGQAQLVLLSSQVGSLESSVASSEAAMSSTQAMVQEMKESNKALTQDLQAQQTALAGRVDDISSSVKRVERSANASVAELRKQIADLEVQMKHLTSKAEGRALDKSVDWATLGVGARIDYGETVAGIGRDFSRRLAWSVSDYTGFFRPEGSYPWPVEVVLEKHLLLTPGRCFSMPASGNVTVRLPLKIRVDTVGLEHITTEVKSQPKDVRAISGDYVLADWDASLKTSVRVEPARLTDRVTFQINSNLGLDFTCVYRLNVHGAPLSR